MVATTPRTALDIMGITEDRFKYMFGEDDGPRNIEAVKSALLVVAHQNKSRAQSLKVWEAIGVTEKTFGKLDVSDQKRLTAVWVYNQNSEIIDQRKFAADEAERLKTKQDFYARSGMTEAQYLALGDDAKAAIVKTLAEADAVKSRAASEASGKTHRAIAWAAAAGIAAIFAAIAATSFASSARSAELQPADICVRDHFSRSAEPFMGQGEVTLNYTAEQLSAVIDTCEAKTNSKVDIFTHNNVAYTTGNVTFKFE